MTFVTCAFKDSGSPHEAASTDADMTQFDPRLLRFRPNPWAGAQDLRRLQPGGPSSLVIREGIFQSFQFRFARAERQLDLAALDGGAADGHHDLQPFVGALAVAGMNFLRIVEPVGDLLDIGGHVVGIVHATRPRNHSTGVPSNSAPAPASEDLGEAFRALGPYAAFPPPVINFRNVRRAIATLNNAANAVCELDETCHVVWRGMIIGKLFLACRLAHRPFRFSKI